MKNFALALVALLPACTGSADQATAQNRPREFQPSGDYVHKASGVRFPERIGRLVRTGITEFDAEAQDVSAGYNLNTPDLKGSYTIYIYPSPSITSIGSPANVVESAREKLCSDEFDRVKTEIEGAHPGAALVTQDNIASPSASFSKRGKRAIYSMSEAYWGRQQPLRSEVDLFCYVAEKWTVKYRITAPADVDYAGTLGELMRAIAWPQPR